MGRLECSEPRQAEHPKLDMGRKYKVTQLFTHLPKCYQRKGGSCDQHVHLSQAIGLE